MVAIPIVLLALVVLHLLALHEVGSNNPDGVEIKKHKDERGIPKDGIPFHPYYTIHDMVGVVVFLFVFCTVVFFSLRWVGIFLKSPTLSHGKSLENTRAHCSCLVFHTILCHVAGSDIPLFGVDAKFWGVVVMGGAIAILFVLPWLDRSPVKSIRYKGWLSKIWLVILLCRL